MVTEISAHHGREGMVEHHSIQKMRQKRRGEEEEKDEEEVALARQKFADY